MGTNDIWFKETGRSIKIFEIADDEHLIGIKLRS